MLPLTGQVRSACDTARRSTARILGMEPTSSEDADKTFGDMQERIKNASAYVGGHPADAFRAAEQRMIEFPQGKESVKLTSREYLTRFSLPNFYFHVTTATTSCGTMASCWARAIISALSLQRSYRARSSRGIWLP